MALRIHHLNCGSMCPYGARLIAGTGGWLAPATLVCHCLLIETGRELILVDTGFGTRDIDHPQSLGRAFRRISRPRLDRRETALAQVEALGFTRNDVRHLIVTHLDLDHAGGLADFPQASVHLFAPELDAALAPKGFERARYRPAQWAHGPRWVAHETMGETWFGFDSVRAVPGSNAEVLLIPLVGHSRGHTGVAVREGRKWLLHCGDAYMHRAEIDALQPHCPPALDLLERLDQTDGKARRHNVERLRRLAEEQVGRVRLFSSHDPTELERCQKRKRRIQGN